MKNFLDHSFWRIIRFQFFRALSLLFAIVVSVWLTIAVASRSGVLESELTGSKIGGWFSGISQMGSGRGANDATPYQGTLPETVELIIRGLTLDLGHIRTVIPDFLARTLLLFGSANLALFFVSILLALLLYRNYGGFLDRLVVALAPLSSVPAWLYGVVLIVFATRVLHFYESGILDTWPSELTWDSLSYIGKRLLLPFLAIFLSKIFQSVYLWRTFFLVHASEDYVEMGKAKGLKNSVLDRKYVVRPALPSLLTNFAILITGIWQEAIILELFFGVAGIGHLFYNMMRYSANSMPLLVGLTITFAYLQALTVFILDIVYVLVDPRVKAAGQQEANRSNRRISLNERLRGWRQIFGKREVTQFPKIQLQVARRREPGEAQITQRTGLGSNLKYFLASIRPVVAEFRRYPSAVFGLVVVLLMCGVSIYTVIAYPYQQTVAQWRSEGNIWRNNPQSAAPAWTNLFRVKKLAESSILSTEDGSASKEIGITTNGMTPVLMEFPFDYTYDEFPTELILRLKTQTDEKTIFVAPIWIMPDGREINAKSISTRAANEEHYLLREESIWKSSDQSRKQAWFAVADSDPPVPLKGRYTLKVEAFLFEPEADIDAEVVLHGQLYGLAGTDNRRRDLLLPLLWGTPVALTFGLVGALLASLVTMILAATGAWFGGLVDAVIQRLTEINMVLPAFPLLVLVYISISKNVWVILGLAILLNMMSNAVKNYRAAFLQIKESAYIEAARSYGASNWRIIFFYLIPRILPVLVPQLVSLAPGLVFLEATLAYLNISDPTLPTWGKLIQESLSSGALDGAYYQVLEPVGLLMITGLALSMMGFALDRILNPKLRDI